MSLTHKIKLTNTKAGFTLLEILLVVGIIALLAGIVIVAINPSKQLADARNAQRRSDVNALANAAYQYLIDSTPAAPHIISDLGLTDGTCAADVSSMESLINPTYISAIPTDPSDGSGYTGGIDTSTGRVNICAPMAENGATIDITK